MKRLLIIALFFSISITFSQQRKTYHIGILYDRQIAHMSDLLHQLKKEITSVVGKDAIISFSDKNILANDFNLDKAKQNYQRLINNQTDIILAFGMVNSIVINREKKYEKPVLLFGDVSSDFVSFSKIKNTSGIKNLNYIIENSSFKKDLLQFKKLTNFKKVGIVIEKEVADMLPLKEKFDSYLNNYKIIKYKTVEEILNSIKDFDAVYFAGGFSLSDKAKEKIIQFLIKNKISSFTATGIKDVKRGFMATNKSEDSINQFFKRIALNIEQYINGTPLADLPIKLIAEKQLTINYNTAKAIKIPIKYSLLANTNFVGDINKNISEKKYSYLEVINQMLAKNLSLKSNKKEVNLSVENTKEAKSDYLPNLSASALSKYVDPKAANILNPEFSTRGTLSLNQVLFSEPINAGISIQKEIQKAQEETYNAQELDAILISSQSYFNTLILKTNVAIQSQNLKLTKENLKIATQNFEAGQSSKTDVLRFKSQLAQNTLTLVKSINQLKQGYIGLNKLLNNKLNLDIDIEKVTIGKGAFSRYKYNELKQMLDNPKLSDLFTSFLVLEAKRNSPELKALQHNLNGINRKVRLNSAGRFLPTIALQGQYNVNFYSKKMESNLGLNPYFPNYNVGVNISLPVFNQNKTNINKQIGIIQREQTEINKENRNLSIDENVRNDVLNLKNQIANVELSKVSENAAKENLDLVQTSYANGAVSFIQLIDAQNNYLESQIANANANYNFIINALQLERSIGYNFLIHTKSENEQFKARFLEYIKTIN